MGRREGRRKRRSELVDPSLELGHKPSIGTLRPAARKEDIGIRYKPDLIRRPVAEDQVHIAQNNDVVDSTPSGFQMCGKGDCFLRSQSSAVIFL